MKKLSALDIAGIALSVVLLICLFSLPYGFYTFVRFYTMIVMVCFAISFQKKRQTTLMVIAAATALLFQPFFKISLGRDLWNVLDVVLAIALLCYIIFHKKNKI